MSQHDLRVTLEHIRDHGREAIAFARGRRREDLDSDRMLELALTRLVEVVGEACTRVSDRDRAHLDAIPWRPWIGMRNRLIHGYDRVDRDILWSAVEADLPLLVDQVESALTRL